ncbi:ferritin-like domain-containing protein [Pseudenhygromyxa sp. WMMC2535]|uniref:ferritin-like domain-containing protein n=1 Tax=Pseudenhygromyxa sp. WMMC2535 TaxID=2712867 RepID=UPI0015562528|nr:ferritin-like domain-containing protein [Pseudenhygromyxa sp. WMMC2535]NVB43276.1 ferritin-like domain-containing protein [Pseudenhygromyxa sp. WMMC2535]
MRDTDVLRRRLSAQIGLSLAATAMLGACDGEPGAAPAASEARESAPSEATPAAATESEAGEASRVKTAGRRTTTSSSTPSYVPPRPVQEIPEGEFDYFGPGRDPVAIDRGEEACPSGQWCGVAEDARKFAASGVPDQLGCPSQILAKPAVANGLDQAAERWQGLSFHPMMRGGLMTSETEEKRASQGEQALCCYHWFEYCSGRPLLDGEEAVLAELLPGSSWCCEAIEVAAPLDRPDDLLPDELRARLGELWVEDGRMEHAAIAAFMRATLELMAMAAPSELLAEIQQAAQDEVEHAQRCFGLAARFSGEPREPGALPALEPRVGAAPEGSSADWVRLVVDTFVEGCVGETIAALVARRAMRHCEDPATSYTLEQVVDDEGRHAGLAWRTVRWALEHSGEHRDDVIEALVAQARGMVELARAACTELPAADPQAELLARFGRLDRRTELRARRDAWEELILPTLDALLTTLVEPGSEAWA